MYVVNDSAFPLVAAFIFGELTQEDLALMQERAIVNRERGRHVSLIDGRRAKMPDAKMRRAIADLMHALDGPGRENVVSSAIVLGSTAAVGVLTALQWLAPPKHPLKYFNAAAEALAWLRTQSSDVQLGDDANKVVAKMDELIATDGALATFDAFR